MKYLKTLLIAVVILLSDYFINGLEFLSWVYIIMIVSVSIILGLGTWFLQNLIISNSQEIKKETRKITFYIDIILILTSSIYLFYASPYILFPVWIIPIAVALFIGIPYFIATRKATKQ